MSIRNLVAASLCAVLLGCVAEREAPPTIPANGFPVELAVSGDDRDWRGTAHITSNGAAGPLSLEVHGRHYDPSSDTVTQGGPFIDLAVFGRPAQDGSFVTSALSEVDFALPQLATTSEGVPGVLLVREIREADVAVTGTAISGYVVVSGVLEGRPEETAEARIDISGPIECRATTDVAIEFADGSAGVMRCPAVAGEQLFVME